VIETRKYLCKQAIFNVNYTVRGRSYQDKFQDISIEGVFIRTREMFSVGDELTLTISHSSQKRPIRIPGEVVRIESNGVGVKFKKRSQAQAEVIKAIIKKMCDSDLQQQHKDKRS